MTPLMAKALVRAQDVARLMEWSEEPAARVVGWGRASLNQADLALLPAGVDRDSAGLWTRAWSLLHVSGDYYAWSVKSTSSDLRALAEAYRSVLGMAVVVADDNDVSAPAWATSGQRLLSAKTPSGPNSGKRPPWVRDAAPTPDPDALDRMATEAPWAAQTGDVAAGTSPAVDSHAGAAPPTAAGEAKHGRHGPTGRDEPAPAGAEDHPGCAGPGARGAGDGGPVAGGASLGAGSDLAGGRADAGDPRGTPGPGGGSALTAERENRALDALVVLALRPDLRDSVENVTALAGEGTPPPSHPSPAGAPDSWGKCVECGNETTSSTWHHGGKTSACCRRCYNDDTVHKCNGCDGSNGWERLQRAASAQREAEAALVALGPGLSSMSVQASTTYGEARCGSCVPCERAQAEGMGGVWPAARGNDEHESRRGVEPKGSQAPTGSVDSGDRVPAAPLASPPAADPTPASPSPSSSASTGETSSPPPTGGAGPPAHAAAEPSPGITVGGEEPGAARDAASSAPGGDARDPRRDPQAGDVVALSADCLPEKRWLVCTNLQVEGSGHRFVAMDGLGESRETGLGVWRARFRGYDWTGQPLGERGPVVLRVGAGTLLDAEQARAGFVIEKAPTASEWLPAIGELDETESAGCSLCGEAIEGGDRYQASRTDQRRVAHVLCVQDVEAGRDPRADDAELVQAMGDDAADSSARALAPEERTDLLAAVDSPPFEHPDVAALASRNFERVNRHSAMRPEERANLLAAVPAALGAGVDRLDAEDGQTHSVGDGCEPGHLEAAPPRSRGPARHRWLGADVCVRCGESKASASGACGGKPKPVGGAA